MLAGHGESASSVRLDSQLAMSWPQPFAAQVAEKLVVMPGTDATAVAQYRQLAGALQQATSERFIKTLMITSAERGEGRTVSAVNLALTLSEACGQRVLLVDADLGKPSIHEVFEVSLTPGLCDCLVAPDAVVPVIGVTDHLSVLTAGQLSADSVGALGSARMGRVLVDAAAAFDWVILDAAPVACLSNTSDTTPLATLVDAAVFVIDANKTPRERVAQAIQTIGRERVMGILLNRNAEV